LHIVPTHLAIEHDTFLAPFSEHRHVILPSNDVRNLDDRRVSRVRRRGQHPS